MKKIIYCVIIVLLLISISLILKVSKEKNIKDNMPYSVEYTNPRQINDNAIIPNNFVEFDGSYIKGDIDSKDRIETMNYFGRSIVKKYSLLSEKTDAEIKEYYEKNESQIKSDGLYVKDASDFVAFVHLINGIKVNCALKEIDFVKGSVVAEEDSTKCKVKYTYTNNKSITVNMRVYLKNKGIVFYVDNTDVGN